MSLKSLRYSEYVGDPRHWSLENSDFAQINLVVGRNATGKTRLINVLGGLCKILSGQVTDAYDSGSYHAEIELDAKRYVLDVVFSNREVVSESLEVDGIRRLTRSADGTGEIYYQKQDQTIAFQIARNAIAIQQRRDVLQHPFVADLAAWAQGCHTYQFASAFGATLIGLTSLNASMAQAEGSFGAGDLISTYTRAFLLHKEPFDQAVMSDMRLLGYELLDVGSGDMREMVPGITLPEPVVGMFVIEAGRDVKLPQMSMSQGMYRALALVIHLNVATFSKRRTLILIDDIGEGLDFERSASLIDVLVRHSRETGLQAIMTSNDRFVMNRVPLENWMLLRRKGSIVRSYTERNSPKEFANFKFLGLSNFDLFTSETFR
jgi:energy-coupling factor transporter ATP-binding protein EcfA2